MLNLTHRFANLGTNFYSFVSPTPIPQPYWLHINQDLANNLNLDNLNTSNWLNIISGNNIIKNYLPLASLYAGHQFGVWVPQLGDGRAILIAEHMDKKNRIWELQLKGSGITPYSRFGDGRAVLRSSIREYLVSHVMTSLGIPSTQALAIVGSPLTVYRETAETAAIVLRVAPSFIRFGTFEVLANRNEHANLRKLADFVITNYYPLAKNSANPYLNWLLHLIKLTAKLIAQWQAIGFCHGVMNSDNMSILGLTLDYGPFAFLDSFIPNYICNHSDTYGRYAYHRQAEIAWWNLSKLADCLTSLIPQADIDNALHQYGTWFNQYYLSEMGKKLGITNLTQEDLPLLNDLLAILAAWKADWTIFWRQLSYYTPNKTMILNQINQPEAINKWLDRYLSRRKLQDSCFKQQQELMLNSNPKFILRNHLAQIAIEKAQNQDFTEIEKLFTILSNPFAEQPEFASYANYPPSWAQNIELSCSS